ncbi:MAG: D-alanyl-D-alanine carboxypeptidase family protein [Patescibacteria group bacterium]|jgi:hypothetical protein
MKKNILFKIILLILILIIFYPAISLAADPTNSCCACPKDPNKPTGELELKAPDESGICPATNCKLHSKPCGDETLKKEIEEYNNKINSQSTNETKSLITPSLPTIGNIVTLDQEVEIQGETKGSRYYYIPWIAQMVGGLYKFGVGAAAVLAVVMIVIGGFIWMTSGGDSGRITAAKGYIIGSIVGLILALGSYSILYLVNPELVYLRPIKVPYVEPVNLEMDEVGDEVANQYFPEQNPDNPVDPNAPPPANAPAGVFAAGCAQSSQLTAIPTNSNLSATSGDNRLLTQVIPYLTAASNNAAAKGYRLNIVSAVRTVEHQNKLFQRAIIKYGNEQAARKRVAKPSCNAPHVTGGAVDVNLCKGNECYCEEKCTRPPNSAEKKILEDIMHEAGWVRYCAEWWHFEYGTARWNSAGGATGTACK